MSTKRLNDISELIKGEKAIRCSISSITWERVNIIVEGEALLQKRKAEKCYLILRNLPGESEISIPIRPDEDGKFQSRINITTIKETYPLPHGIWDVFIRIVTPENVYESLFFKNSEIAENENYTKIFRYGRNRYVVNPYIEKAFGHMVVEIVNYKAAALKSKRTIKNMVKATRDFVYSLLYRLCAAIFPQNEKRVLFATDSRSNLSGNMRFVHDRMKERGLDFEYSYLFKEKVTHKRNIRDKLAMPYYLAVSKYIFVDDFYPMIYPLKLRENTELIQLWHAVGAFKTFGYSRVGKIGGPSPFSNHHKNYTKVTVSSQDVVKYYAEGFGVEECKVYPTGIPRTDVFFDKEYEESTKADLYKAYPELLGKKVIMFAPTFRGNGAKTAYYDFDQINYEKLYEMCGDEYVVIFKMHPFVKKGLEYPAEYEGVFYDMSENREINDLLFITDLMITDYSSTCFDYSLLNKPMLFFAYDLEDYISKRDFYYDFESFVPGKICRTFDDLLEAIKNEDYEFEKVGIFRDKFFEHTDGKSTDRVIDCIFNINEGLD
ncbi:MAG: hypothetical protein HGA49_05320 [Eubacteriaceae bacterium]|nr:hypothetical protein [Eubacteriaceae bacterium]